MNKVIDKELIGQLLKLEVDQQEKVVAYIKELLEADEINKRADTSEQAIREGRTKKLKEFNEDFEQWKSRKKVNIK